MKTDTSYMQSSTILKPYKSLISIALCTVFLLLETNSSHTLYALQSNEFDNETNLPTVKFLGVGPGAFDIPEEQFFWVKHTNSTDFSFVPGRSYNAQSGEKVWQIDRVPENPMYIWTDTLELGEINIGCIVSYVQIDDDTDYRRSRFLLNSDPVHEPEQGPIITGTFIASAGGDLAYETDDSIALLVELSCENAPEQLNGRVILERRSGYGGSQICLNDRCNDTLATGEYRFDDVPNGTYSIIANHTSYLRSMRTIEVSDNSRTIPEVTLLAGDINQDDIIDLKDANLIGQAWNSQPSDSYWDVRADVTADETVNILDMTAVQVNWLRQAPGPWTISRGSDTENIGSPTTQIYMVSSQDTLTGINKSTVLDIYIDGTREPYSAYVQLKFDPNVLQIRDANSALPGIQVTIGEVFDPMHGMIIINNGDNETGILDLAITWLFSASSLDSSGRLASVNFQSIGIGSSPIEFTRSVLLDDSPHEATEILSNTLSGQINVNEVYPTFLPLVISD